MATFLPGSGSLSMSQINGVFARGNNLNAYRGTTYYTSTTGPNTFSSGAISFNNFYGTGPSAGVVVDVSSLQSQYFTAYYSSVGVYPVNNVLQFDRDGTWSQWDNSGQQLGNYWATSGASSTVGDNYWVRFTRTSLIGTSVTATATTGWLQINTTRAVTVAKSNSGSISGSAIYTVEVSSSSSGSPVLSTATNITLESSRA